MKKIVITILTLVISNLGLDAQAITFETIKEKFIDLGEVTGNNEEFYDFSSLKELLKNVEIVMLGEQSHGEATTYETKIKLIKYLHKEMDFDLLVFESGFYESSKAWELIENGMDVREAMGKSIFPVWSTTKSLIPLSAYIDKNKNHNTLKLLGFDSQFSSKISKEHLISDLSDYLINIDSTILSSSEWKHLKQNLEYSFWYETKKLKRNQPELDTSYVNLLVQKLSDLPSNFQSDFWAQTLKNIKTHLSDSGLGTDYRDKQMADNLIWLKDKYPKSKIICWGATSHFLYNSTQVRMKNPFVQLLGGKYYKNHQMMGHYVKEEFGEKLYTIGFTAYQGRYGWDGNKKIRQAKKGSLEYLLSQSEYYNFLVPLKGLSFKDYKSRPLGNLYMKNDIATVMDAVIFNRNMRPSRTDFHFFLMIHPENKYIKL